LIGTLAILVDMVLLPSPIPGQQPRLSTAWMVGYVILIYTNRRELDLTCMFICHAFFSGFYISFWEQTLGGRIIKVNDVTKNGRSFRNDHNLRDRGRIRDSRDFRFRDRIG
jgi:hypothetical protein